MEALELIGRGAELGLGKGGLGDLSQLSVDAVPLLLVQTMHHYNLAIPQLMPNGMRVFLGLIVLSEEANIELSVDDVLAIYYP
ncbi:hypothetical protein TIFTF001_039898 [Ficus carica]|uniref:Uncharacterized protein n=1 Tax=Ficus carica TaxID=3494 RepID=A0AA87YP84_FICCA|nr:hypothetical protein TIFTF001_042886 [Ficus carica]GMN19527.1 hypothetical protein TIFTF001_042888 [Ficus carica]GMN19754.1 hypothetical protein TIFTF001_039886 [Ficus carica]GMN19789.1 hypothetical protein TIFTF001_039898 [Ficus carica]